MNHIFFLIPVFFLGIVTIIPLASAEIGENFDRELLQINEDGTELYKWTSSPDRLNIDNMWVNYQFTNTDDYLRFESEAITFEFYKASCDFKLYETGLIDSEPVISSYSTTIAVNNKVINIPVCLIQDITTDIDGVDFNVTRGPATIYYELDYASGVEWTYEVVANGVITITEVCTDCIGNIIDDQRISFGDYTLDTKNDIHGAFKEATQQGNNYWIIYEKTSTGTLIIDPTFNTDSSTGTDTHHDQNNDSVCDTYFGTNTATTLLAGMINSGSAADCYVSSVNFDISSIGAGNITSSVTLELEIDTDNDPEGIAVVSIDFDDIGSRSDTQNFASIRDASSVYVSDWDFLGTGTKSQELGVTARGHLDTAYGTDTYFAIGFRGADLTQGAGDEFDTIQSHTGGNPPNLVIVYSTAPAPDAVDDLSSTDITRTTVDLLWTEPDLNTGNLTDYQINYTTPWSTSVNTIIQNNSGTDVTSQVSGLTELTPYSFRIGVWTESSNMSGNILNITTLEDFTLANFTPGFFDLNATNDDIIQIFFERIDINSTALFLNVTYPNTYNLSCDFSYQFANINQTYSNLSNVTISSNAVESSFQFIDVENEIIDVYCWNENNLDNDGSYIITQTSFPLLEQIANFRNGTYGTAGMFGAMDLITMAVVIISMIGFNRVNESVGAIFNIIFLGSFAYFEIIELPTIIFGAIAVILMLVITTTRKT